MVESTYECEIVAEAGVNHDGDEAVARALIEAAAMAGADAVKFQTFDPDELATVSAPTAAYQAAAGEGARQAEMLRRLALDRDTFARLSDHAREVGIPFLSTPFDIDSARFLVDALGMARIKVGSGELTNLPFLLALARLQRPLILSTGMATLDEVQDALGVVVWGRLAAETEQPSISAARAALAAPEARAILAETVVMQCVTQYPAPPDQANLRVMDTYAAMGVQPGYSDHTPGLDIALAAVARGARMIEKHLTLDRTRPGPDHAASLEPAQMADLVVRARRVEAALGSSEKAPVPSERANMAVARRSLVALRPIRRGERLGPDTVGARRAGGGMAPVRLWDLTGQPAARDYDTGEAIDE